LDLTGVGAEPLFEGFGGGPSGKNAFGVGADEALDLEEIGIVGGGHGLGWVDVGSGVSFDAGKGAAGEGSVDSK
jgi:hypothetical protein